jgi:1-acyl-sn-glycerol-3-phosphate acyltransferase
MLYFFRMVLLGIHFLLASAVNLVIVLLRPFNPDNTRLCGWMYSRPALWLLGLHLELDMQALSAVKGPFVLVANHQSNYDLFIFGCTVPPRTVSIGKTSLRWIPLFGQIYWLAGNVLINRGNAVKAKQAMLKTTTALQSQNTSIWVFAEGTRNLGCGLLPFKKGAFQMAIAAGVPIVPLCSSSYKKHMDLNRWHSGNLIIQALPAISTVGLTQDDLPDLMAQCHAQMQTSIDSLDRAAAKVKSC